MKSTAQNVVEKIHQDFDVAAQGFLDKAQEIISGKVKEMKPEIKSKLKEFGFKRAQNVVEVEEVKKAKGLAKAVAKKVNYYFKNYPFNKFITKEQVKDICKKYGLVFGRTEWFIGEIPEKNQFEIAGFEVKKKDKVEEGVMIVASKDQFDTSGLSMSDEWELKAEIPDPIVLYPVKGGYLIIAKWGPEADIDEIQ